MKISRPTTLLAAALIIGAGMSGVAVAGASAVPNCGYTTNGDCFVPGNKTTRSVTIYGANGKVTRVYLDSRSPADRKAAEADLREQLRLLRIQAFADYQAGRAQWDGPGFVGSYDFQQNTPGGNVTLGPAQPIH